MLSAKPQDRPLLRARRRDDGLKRFDRIGDFLGDQFRRELDAPCRIGAGLDLPAYLCLIRGEAGTGEHGDHLASPIDPDEGYLLFRQPIEHVKRDGPAPVEHNDPRRKCGIALEEAEFLPLLWIVRQAVPDQQRSAVNSQRHPVPAEDQRLFLAFATAPRSGRSLRFRYPVLVADEPVIVFRTKRGAGNEISIGHLLSQKQSSFDNCDLYIMLAAAVKVKIIQGQM